MSTDTFDSPIVQRRTSVAETGIQKPAGAARSVFDAATPPARKRSTVPRFDPLTVEIRKGEPLPALSTAPGGSPYKALLNRLQPGDSVVLLERQAKGVMAMANKMGVKVALRRLDAERTGVWRI